MMRPYEQRFPWNLDWNLLRTFTVIVEQGGITRAANFLGVTQPTISSALKRLEDTVDQRLVERHPSHFSVTRAGRVLFEECNSVFGSVSQIPWLLKDTETRVSGHVSIVMASHVVSPHFDDVLAKFNKDHPDVTYSISIAESAEVMNRVRQNRVTLGICLMREKDKSLDTELLFREYFALYCGKNHRLFGAVNIELSDLLGENSVSFQTDAESGPLFSVTELREKALLTPTLKGISANLPEVRRMIVAGIGIGALPVHVAQRDIDLGNLWRLPPHTGLPAVDIYLTTSPKRSMNPAEKALVQAIRDMTKTVSLDERTYS